MVSRYCNWLVLVAINIWIISCLWVLHSSEQTWTCLFRVPSPFFPVGCIFWCGIAHFQPRQTRSSCLPKWLSAFILSPGVCNSCCDSAFLGTLSVVCFHSGFNMRCFVTWGHPLLQFCWPFGILILDVTIQILSPPLHSLAVLVYWIYESIWEDRILQ